MIAQKYLNKRTPSLAKKAAVADIWQEILPEVFYEHCSLAGISRGVLHIEVDPGPFMHELQALSNELLLYLQSRCGGAGIEKIRLRPRKIGYYSAKREHSLIEDQR